MRSPESEGRSAAAATAAVVVVLTATAAATAVPVPSEEDDDQDNEPQIAVVAGIAEHIGPFLRAERLNTPKTRAAAERRVRSLCFRGVRAILCRRCRSGDKEGRNV